MDLSKEYVRGLLLYDFKFGESAAASSRRINAAFGEGTVSERIAQDWFRRFRNGDFNLEDSVRSGRSSKVDNDRLRQLVELDPRQTTRELAQVLGVHFTTIADHLHQLGKVHKLAQWVPHELTERDRQRRAQVATELLSYRRTNNWLTSIITGDEKWCLYVNIKRRRHWVDKDKQPEPQPRTDLHPLKVMICVWWDVRGIIHYELLPRNTTITADLYCQQLDRLALKIAEKRPNHGTIRFLHDNARPHTARVTRQKLLDIGWEVMPHPPYSPDLAPTDYHLFLSLSNAIQGKTFDNQDAIDRWLNDFFKSKPEQFYAEGIRSLPKRWQKVIDCNGDYFIS